MPFLAEEHIGVPNKDLLSWMFDDQNYDKDAPVRRKTERELAKRVDRGRSMSMPQIQNVPSLRGKHGASRTDYVPASNQ
jgi:hypothetical protein